MIYYCMPAKKLQCLYDVPAGRWQLLGDKIKAARGRVILLVHPFYSSSPFAYRRAALKLIKQTRVPVIIVEEALEANKAVERLRRLNAGHLVLPSEMGGPNILLKRYKTSRKPAASLLKKYPYFPVGDFILDRDQIKLAEKLEEIGAKTVLVAGMLSETEYDPVFHHSMPSGCVVWAHDGLLQSGKFNVRYIRKAVHPQPLVPPGK